jgi:hypothetical protein
MKSSRVQPHPTIPSSLCHPQPNWNSNLAERSAQVPDTGVSVGPDRDNQQALVRVRKGAIVARTWRGWVRTEQAAAYVESITRTGLSEYEKTPGKVGAGALSGACRQ